MIDEEIEFIDTGADTTRPASGPIDLETSREAPNEPAMVRTGRRSSAGAVILAAVVAAVGIAALTNGDEDGAEPIPATTPPPTPSTTATLPPLPTRRSGALIGDGPSLEWQRVNWETSAPEFQWIGDAFLGSEGDSYALVRPSPRGANVVIRTSAVDGGEATVISSSEVLAFDGPNPSRLIVYTRAGSRFIDLDPMMVPGSDLVTTEYDLAVEVNDDRALILQTASGVLNTSEFRSRTGIDLPTIYGIGLTSTLLTAFGEDGEASVELADLDLSADDLEALRSIERQRQTLTLADLETGATELVGPRFGEIEWLATVGDEFMIGGNELAHSTDGTTWQRAADDAPRFGVPAPGPDGTLIAVDFPGEDPVLTRSTDAGRGWAQTPAPIRNPWSLVSVGDVVAATGWQTFEFGSSASTWSVLTNDFELAITASEQRFELLTRAGDLILSGLFGDPESGFRSTAGSSDMWFVDPETGDEIARFTQRQIASSFAAERTLAGDPQLIAISEWEPGDANPEWSLRPVTNVFGSDALAVSFVAGDGWLMADVTTRSGRELYLAEAPDTRGNAEG